MTTNTTAQHFRKKPVVIEAFQMTEARRMDNSEWPEWLNMAWNGQRDAAGTLQRVSMGAALPDRLEIITLEGNHLVSWGDWIIRGVMGELYPCKPDIFAATYEPASPPPAAQPATAGDAALIALREAEVGLEVACARVTRSSDFEPAEHAALRIVRAAIGGYETRQITGRGGKP